VICCDVPEIKVVAVRAVEATPYVIPHCAGSPTPVLGSFDARPDARIEDIDWLVSELCAMPAGSVIPSMGVFGYVSLHPEPPDSCFKIIALSGLS
jgi:hypothetical protein